MKRIKFKQWDCTIAKASYPNKRVALLLESIDGEPIAKATVNLPEVELRKNEVIIKDYSENEGMLECLVSNGIVEDTGKTVRTGHSEVHICKLLI